MSMIYLKEWTAYKSFMCSLFAYNDADSGPLVLVIVSHAADLIMACRSHKAKEEVKTEALGWSRPILGSWVLISSGVALGKVPYYNHWNENIVLITRDWSSLVAHRVRNLPATQETWVRSLGREDTLEKGMATYSSILAWRISWTKEPGGLQSMGSQRTRCDQTTFNFHPFFVLLKN